MQFVRVQHKPDTGRVNARTVYLTLSMLNRICRQPSGVPKGLQVRSVLIGILFEGIGVILLSKRQQMFSIVGTLLFIRPSLSVMNFAMKWLGGYN
jgi:hypothetical protein